VLLIKKISMPFEYDKNNIPFYISKPAFSCNCAELKKEYIERIEENPQISEKTVMSNGITLGEFAIWYISKTKQKNEKKKEDSQTKNETNSKSMVSSCCNSNNKN
jgi:hypothetical protein